MSVSISLACGAYDRTSPLVDGRVTVEGVDLTVVLLKPEECFWRMMRYAEFDVAEMSLGSFAVASSEGDDRFVGLPVFPSRSFRHSAVFLRPNSEIESPADLAGMRIGIPEYQMTVGVWVRGLLNDEYGLSPQSVEWVTGGLDSVDRSPLTKPQLYVDGIDVARLESGTLLEALRKGSIDALISPRRPPETAITSGVRRLFPDYLDRELEYFQRTSNFPIMHLVVLRRELAEQNPWICQSITKAMTLAKDLALEELYDPQTAKVSMPFYLAEVERQANLFGSDSWPYGWQANAAQLQTFCRYLFEQGLTSETLDAKALFAPSTLSPSKI